MCHGNRKSQQFTASKAPPPPIKVQFFQQQNPGSAVLMALICAHLDSFFYFFLLVFVAFWVISAEGGQWRERKAQSLHKERQRKTEGALAEQRHCVNLLGVTEKYDSPFFNKSTYQQSALRSTV